ncbi:MAG: hypothetical protein KF690_02350 [Bacteroidetes bacterium]|nr:hypothetical protein [Bacteroidota bacterium]
METQLKELIADFFQKKSSFRGLLKANPDKFKPIVFQEFTDTTAYQEFSQSATDRQEVSQVADRVFSAYIQTDLN